MSTFLQFLANRVPATMPADMSPAVSKTSTLSNGAKVVTLENSHTVSYVIVYLLVGIIW